jgi:MFS family permease
LVYALVLAFFFVTVFLLVGIKAQRTVVVTESGAFAALQVGLNYARTRPDILGSYLVDLIAMTLAYPVAVLTFASDLFHSRYALGVLFAGIPFGAMLASVTSSWTAKVHHYGRAVILAAATWGLGIALLGVAPNLWVAFLALTIAGASDAISGIFRITMWNESVSTELRGRMGGIELLSYAVGPVLGNLRSGVSAGIIGLRTSIVAAGLGCTALVGTASVSLRSFWNFDVRSDPNVAAVKAQRALEHTSETPTV